MKIDKTGFILYTEKYPETVKFYKDVFGLKTLYEKEMLTCLDFHGSYLMIELDDEENLEKGNPFGRDRHCLRFNVPDVKKSCKILDQHNIEYQYYEFDWGKLAKFRDPDGNLIGLRSAKEHREDSEKG